MICKICGVNDTDNPDDICDDCKFSIISSFAPKVSFDPKVPVLTLKS